jgi:hypothetical protein
MPPTVPMASASSRPVPGVKWLVRPRASAARAAGALGAGCLDQLMG